MVQAAKPIPTTPDRLRRSIAREAELYALIRNRNRTVAQTVNPIFGQSSGGSAGGTGFLKTSGDTMIGPIAFFPNAVTIATGAIDIGIDTDKFAGRIIIAGEGAANDDLDTITGAAFAGQLLILQSVTGQTITLTNAGNIQTSTGSNLTLNPQDNMWLVFDSVDQKWKDITAPGSGGGGVTFPVDPVIKDFGTTSGTLALKLDASDTGDGHSFKVTMNGNVTLTFDNPPASGTQHEFEVEFVQDATGGRTVTHPASVVETVTINSAASTTTIITYRTNDGGTNYHAIPALRGTISLGGSGQTPWVGDIDADGFDLKDLSNIEFRSTTGTPAASTPSIHVDTSGDMLLNVALADQIFNTINNVTIGQFGQIGGNNDSFFQITSIDSALPLLKFFNDDSTMSAGAEAARIEFFSNDGGSVSMIYADITVDTENVTAANEAGSMHLGATINGDVSTTTFLSLNNSDDDKITPWKNIHMATGIDIEMVTNDIWLDEVADGTRVFGTATALSFDVAGTFVGSFSSSALSLQGTTTLSIPELFTMTDTGATPGSTVAAIWQNTGGMNFQTGNVADDFDFQFAGGSDLLIKEDGELQFNTSGKQHKIVPSVSSLDLVAELETDDVELWPGAGRDNEALRCGDLSASFKNEPGDAAYEIFVENTVAVTTSQPAIGGMGFRADNVANNARAYGGLVGAIEEDTTASRNGRMQLVVAADDGETEQTLGTLTGIGFDIRAQAGVVQLGFYGATPVVQPSHIVDADGTLADITTKFNQLLADIAGQGLQAAS